MWKVVPPRRARLRCDAIRFAGETTKVREPIDELNHSLPMQFGDVHVSRQSNTNTRHQSLRQMQSQQSPPHECRQQQQSPQWRETDVAAIWEERIGLLDQNANREVRHVVELGLSVRVAFDFGRLGIEEAAEAVVVVDAR